MNATSRATSPAPTVEALDEAVENATLSEIMLCATAGIDMIVGDWNDVSSFDAAVETDTYRIADAIASMTFGLTFHRKTGMPTLVTAVVSAGTQDGSVVLLSVSAPVRTSDIQGEDRLRRPHVAVDLHTFVPTGQVATMLARALHEVMAVATVPELAGGDDPLATIRDIVAQATVFDPDRMRLRIDDHHGNRSFVQFDDGEWKAFAIDGRRVRFSYCFGNHGPEDEIVRDLAGATTVHGIQRAAMNHVRGLQDVQVEARSERHRWNGERFVFV